jgi:predicted MFS family arabinose efflux permease
LVGPLGYRGLFAAIAGVGVVSTAIVVAFIPETLPRHKELDFEGAVEPMATTSDLSTVP